MIHADNDAWLGRWLPLLIERSHDRRVLELGCGSGRDSIVLAAVGLAVIGVDRSPSALAEARLKVPGAEFHEGDLRQPFPVSGPLGVVIASLALHYFSWNETVAIVERVHQTLDEAGVLVLRVNSTEDHEYGASGHPRLGDNFYLVDGHPKRFFDRAALEALFVDGWRTLHLEPRVIRRYARPKSIWEGVFERRSFR